MEERAMPSAVPVTAPDGGTWVKIDTISVSTLSNRNAATGISSSVTLQNRSSYTVVGFVNNDSPGLVTGSLNTDAISESDRRQADRY